MLDVVSHYVSKNIQTNIHIGDGHGFMERQPSILGAHEITCEIWLTLSNKTSALKISRFLATHVNVAPWDIGNAIDDVHADVHHSISINILI